MNPIKRYYLDEIRAISDKIETLILSMHLDQELSELEREWLLSYCRTRLECRVRECEGR